jgi:hypothetical protein
LRTGTNLCHELTVKVEAEDSLAAPYTPESLATPNSDFEDEFASWCRFHPF